MRHCAACALDIEGDWSRCPLCTGPVAGDVTASPFPAVPLRFSRRRVLRVLVMTSIALILASYLAQLLFSRGIAGIGALRSVWLGVATMWLVVLMAERNRRNLAKGTAYLVALVSLVSVYWDYLTGWHGWSLTYVVPLVNVCAIVALLIIVRMMRIEIGDHIVYSGLTLLLGLAPIAFLALGWVTNPLPSGICGALGTTLVLTQLTRGPDLRHELAKRLHL